MATQTFNNLNPQKQEKIITVLYRIFCKKPFHEVTVNEIVQELQIARGSFYQYFENLESAYFFILNRELIDIHRLFLTTLQERQGDLKVTFREYGDRIITILFAEEHYGMYKNCFLYRDEDLERKWEALRHDHCKVFVPDDAVSFLDIDQVQFIKGVIHTLIERNFREEWSQEEFRQKYNHYVGWILQGVL